MNKKILAVMAALVLTFSAGMTINTAKADDYNTVAEYEEDYQEHNEEDGITALSYSEPADADSADSVKTILICIVIGCIIGGVVTMTKVSSMKSVRKQLGASDYKKADSFKLDINTDNYLYNRIEKTPLPQQTSNNNSGQSKP